MKIRESVVTLVAMITLFSLGQAMAPVPIPSDSLCKENARVCDDELECVYSGCSQLSPCDEESISYGGNTYTFCTCDAALPTTLEGVGCTVIKRSGSITDPIGCNTVWDCGEEDVICCFYEVEGCYYCGCQDESSCVELP